MHPFLYSLHISTFATWLSIAGASGVALVLPRYDLSPVAVKMESPQKVEGEPLDLDSFAAGSSSQAEIDSEDNTEEIQQPSTATMEMPAVPDMPEIVETAPLPEIPAVPDRVAPSPKPRQEKPPVASPRPASRPVAAARTGQASSGSTGPVAKRTTQGTGTGSSSSGGTGAGNGPVGAARFAGGRKPKPPYPSAAKKANIEGTVTVLIAVDEDGNVVNAKVLSASAPQLNDPQIENTLRRWKYNKGARGSITQKIHFKLH